MSNGPSGTASPGSSELELDMPRAYTSVLPYKCVSVGRGSDVALGDTADATADDVVGARVATAVLLEPGDPSGEVGWSLLSRVGALTGECVAGRAVRRSGSGNAAVSGVLLALLYVPMPWAFHRPPRRAIAAHQLESVHNCSPL